MSGHSWNGGIGYTLKAFIFLTITRKKTRSASNFESALNSDTNGQRHHFVHEKLVICSHLQAVSPVEGDNAAVRGSRQLHPGAVHRHQVVLQARLVPRAHMEHPLPIDLPTAQRQSIHMTGLPLCVNGVTNLNASVRCYGLMELWRDCFADY